MCKHVIGELFTLKHLPQVIVSLHTVASVVYNVIIINVPKTRY